MNVLLLSTQYNRYGGAATCAYETHKYLIDRSINSAIIFFDNYVEKNPEKLNIDTLPNVYSTKLLNNYLDDDFDLSCYQELVTKITELLSDNFIILGFNYLAPVIGKKLFENKKIYYMITGTCYINDKNIRFAQDLINNNFTEELNTNELTAIKYSDYIVPNSELMKNLLINIYKNKTEQVYDLHEIYNCKEKKKEISLYLDEDYIKKWDLIYICSNFSRKVKNVDLVKKIFDSVELKDMKKIVIGKNSKDYFNNSIENLTIVDFIEQEEIYKYLKKSKIVLIPSYIESYSITMVEAWENTCIPLTSLNVGCNKFINKFYIVENYEVSKWIEKIILIQKNYVYHHKTFYLNYKQGNSINKLLFKYKNESNKKNVLFVTVDTPGIGGAATNTYNLISNLHDDFNVYSIFVTDDDIDKIENLENYFILKNNTNLIELLNNIYEYFLTSNIEIHTIFCKNYKVLINIKNVFKNINIIFSPSGLRHITNLAQDNYVNYLEVKTFSNAIYNNTYSVQKFFTMNDIYLDYLAMLYSDVIIPNSVLTFNLINKIYPKTVFNNLFIPVYTTNINLLKYENNPTKNWSDREYDILFCAFSWSRQCKNVEIIYKIINNTKDKKIMVIGKNFDLEAVYNKSNTIKYVANLTNSQIQKIYTKCKILVIPSFYDSNPNVLIEAVSNGCGIITTNNVGNSENINEDNLVLEPNDLSEWINKIENLLDTGNFVYKGPSGSDIKNQLIKIISEQEIKKSIVSIYKINPQWDNDDDKVFSYFTFDTKTDDKFVKDIVEYDIYFDITYRLGLELECNDINYIVIDTTINQNECYYVYKSLPYFEGYVKIWKIRKKNDLFYFSQANYYFLRGNYHKFYNKLIESYKAKVIFYPATSFKHINVSENNNLNPVIYEKNPYDIVLVHEDPMYKIFYKNNKCIEFKKFAPDSFINLGLQRTWDICYVATEKQATKNHHLFLDFLMYLEENNYNLKIIYVGNLTQITKDKNYQKKFKNIKLDNKNNVSKQEIINIYNRSKINMLFSGRDAYPRVIPESLSCGCFNIALDTLKDGISIYDGFFGKLVGDASVEIIIINESNSYVPSIKLWNPIIKLVKKNYNHDKISVEFKKKYNINNFINELKNNI